MAVTTAEPSSETRPLKRKARPLKREASIEEDSKHADEHLQAFSWTQITLIVGNSFSSRQPPTEGFETIWHQPPSLLDGIKTPKLPIFTQRMQDDRAQRILDRKLDVPYQAHDGAVLQADGKGGYEWHFEESKMADGVYYVNHHIVCYIGGRVWWSSKPRYRVEMSEWEVKRMEGPKARYDDVSELRSAARAVKKRRTA